MLDEPPKTTFNVTQSFALFSSVLLWTKNRAWVAGNCGERGDWDNPADHLAHDVREAIRGKLITEAPWSLTQVMRRIALVDGDDGTANRQRRVNGDFEAMTAQDFFKWLRDALAHGDGRTIRPMHKVSPRTGNALLAGFRIVFEAERGAARRLTLDLFHADMRRMGTVLADLYCKALSGGDGYFEQEAGTARIEEASPTA